MTRDPNRALGSVELKVIDVSGHVRNDTAVKAELMLHRLILEDTRPGRSKGITRFARKMALVWYTGHLSSVHNTHVRMLTRIIIV